MEIRRPDDNELCGFVEEADGSWYSCSVFGGRLAVFSDRAAAIEHVVSAGLASLAERWWFRESSAAEWQVACIVEASPESVTLALDYFSAPGVPTLTVSRQQLGSQMELSLSPTDLTG